MILTFVDGELKRTQNVVVPGSEAVDGMWQKKHVNNESNNWKSDHSTYFALRSLYLNIWSCLNSELHQLQVKQCYFCSI